MKKLIKRKNNLHIPIYHTIYLDQFVGYDEIPGKNYLNFSISLLN
jgi:hypothetical protein